MKTLLRTYHAIPALQTTAATRKGLQDVPRAKASLKGCVLDNERHQVPFTLKEVETRRVCLLSPSVLSKLRF